MTSDLASVAAHPSAGRVLPPPQKPKKRGHQPAVSEEDPVAEVQEEPLASSAEPTRPPSVITPSQESSSPPSAKRSSTTAAMDKGTAKTVYSDPQIDDFLHQVRVEATVARLDLTHSAVWRLAMHEFMDHHHAPEVVQHFTRTDSKSGQVGRPKR